MWERVKNVPLKMQDYYYYSHCKTRPMVFVVTKKCKRDGRKSPKCLIFIFKRTVLTYIKHFKYMYILGTNNEVQG